ncbi:MAG: NlpC/P60 family protein [Candidatus Jorgensenbacteria bacterium]
MAEYRAVKNRCAVDLAALGVPLPKEGVIISLAAKGFRIVAVDVVALARARVGIATYRRGARVSEAPEVVDCSSFVKWLYGERGIWLPRRSIQQRELGAQIALPDLMAGDLVFRSGSIDYYLTDPADGIGHVGLATGEGTVIHAANRTLGVVESPLAAFAAGGAFRGARRLIPAHREVLTFLTPPEREVETSDDVRWIVLQSLTGALQSCRA